MATSDDRPARIELGGNQTIACIEETRALLLAGLAQSEAVTVDCAAVEEVDLTLVQVLLAARASAARSGKRLVLTGMQGGPLGAVLLDAGFGRDGRFCKGGEEQ